MVTKRLLDRKALTRLFRPSHFPKPIYSCPLCRTSVVLPPTKDKTLTALAAASGLVDHTEGSSGTVEERHPFQFLFPCIFTDKIPLYKLEGLGAVDDDFVDGMVMQYFPELLDSETEDEDDDEER